jgi:hypothetical protein
MFVIIENEPRKKNSNLYYYVDNMMGMIVQVSHDKNEAKVFESEMDAMHEMAKHHMLFKDAFEIMEVK